jgi:NAD(P)-dependent dehydrogenase (short-subunit alcohol dehydrogenase family)
MATTHSTGWGLDGVPAVVLGAGPGIGAEVARLLVARGARVMLGSRREEPVRATQADLAELGPTSTGVVEVTDRASVQEFLRRTTDEIGSPRIVIDIIGRAQQKPFAQVSDGDWDEMMDINLRQQYIIAQETLELLADGGALTFIGSMAGNISSPRNVPYGASKAGLVSLARSLAVEYGPRGVRVNVVNPGTTVTPRMAEFFAAAPQKRVAFEQTIPLGRLAEASEVAEAAVWVSSPLASYVSGQVLGVDGAASANYQLAVMSDG